MAELKSCQIVGTPYLDGKYIAVADMWPLEAPELNRLYPFYDNLKQGRWTTTRCKKCGHIAYPPGVACTNCWSDDLEWIDCQDGKSGRPHRNPGWRSHRFRCSFDYGVAELR